MLAVTSGTLSMEELERGLSDHDAQTEVVDWLIAQSVAPDGPAA